MSGYAQSLQPGRSIAITGVTVIDVSAGNESAAVHTNQTVIVVDGHVAASADSRTVAIPRDAVRVDGTGKYVIPGLWDMHTHALWEERLDRWFRLFLANGVTGIRDMGSPLSLERIGRIREECESGARPGPRIIANGQIFGGGFRDLQAPGETPEEVRATVRKLKADGADFIKVSSFLSRELFVAVAEEAKRQGLPMAGHVPEAVRIVDAAAAGMKSFEHSYGLLQACSAEQRRTAAKIQEALAGKEGSEALSALVRTTDRLYGDQVRNRTFEDRNCAETATALAGAGTWQCPTLVVRKAFATMADLNRKSDPRIDYMDEAARRSWPSLGRTYGGAKPLDAREQEDRKLRLDREGRTVVFLAARGVPVLAGTDVGNPYVFPGFSLHEELALLVKAGLSPLAALRAATLDAARFLGREKEFGTVERGKFADLVLLAANPLEDIGNTEKIWAVVARGRYLGRTELDGLLRK